MPYGAKRDFMLPLIANCSAALYRAAKLSTTERFIIIPFHVSH